jgi:hypothetical protein
MPTSLETAPHEILPCLTRRGSYLRSTPEGVTAFVPHEGTDRALASFTASALAAAVEEGWLRPASEERWVLSEKGRSAVRAVRSAALPPPGGSGSAQPALASNPAESPLGWLASRRDKSGQPLISDEQFRAGERLRADFWFAHMTPRTTASWTATPASRRERRGAPGAGIDLQDHIVAAKERVRRALGAVGPEMAGILIDVCCHLKGLEQAERAVGWPQRAGKVVLQLALTRLARHYGLLAPGPAGWSERSPIRHWGADDYRPSLE